MSRTESLVAILLHPLLRLCHGDTLVLNIFRLTAGRPTARERIASLGILANVLDSRFFKHPLLRKYTALVNEDLTATYSRDIQKWLLVAPIIGVLTGLIITGIAVLVLDVIWAALLPYYLAHHWAIVVGLVAGFFVTGLIMQFCTPDPDEHSTEEIVRSYHEHQGDIDISPFWWKLLAADDHRRLGRQRGARRTEHLQRRRNRLVAVDQAAADSASRRATGASC